MYSRWQPPRGKIYLKQPQRTTPRAYRCGVLIADSHDGDLWYVFSAVNGWVEAIFYSKPNQHNWSASETHAKCYANRSLSINPFELDQIA